MDILTLNEEHLFCFAEGGYSIFSVASDMIIPQALFGELTERYFVYPFYIVFEGYDDVRSDVLTDTFIEWLSDVATVLTLTGNVTYHAPIPSFRATIDSRETLRYFIRHYYRYAEENNFLVATQYKHVAYKPVIQDRRTQSFAYLHAKMHSHFVMFGHDADTVIVGTTTEKTEEGLYSKLTQR